MIALRAYDHIDSALAPHDFGALRLGDAAGNADQYVLAGGAPLLFKEAQLAELGEDFLRGALADVAGVEQDEISVFRGIGADIAFHGQKVGHALGIVHIHLTTI
ncbi:MAG: hypothetical protein NVSMB26_20040 [Beijerinckiaceae bacterium]